LIIDNGSQKRQIHGTYPIWSSTGRPSNRVAGERCMIEWNVAALTVKKLAERGWFFEIGQVHGLLKPDDLLGWRSKLVADFDHELEGSLMVAPPRAEYTGTFSSLISCAQFTASFARS
jgi:hypothetical protein